MLRTPVQRSAGYSTPARYSTRESIANPFEMFWRFSSAGWMPKAQAWPVSNWMPGNASLQAWNPYAAAWGRSPYASWAPLGDWASWSGPCYWPAWNPQPAGGLFAAPVAMSQAALRYASSSAYASYRTPGGHAVAQIIAPVSDTVIAGLTARAVFTQMQSMLGAWRAALGG
jgi:hypothetical protein